MSQKPEEVRALDREGARAIRHILVLWLGLPMLATLLFATLGGIAGRVGAGHYFAALGLTCVGVLLLLGFGRFLWNVIKK